MTRKRSVLLATAVIGITFTLGACKKEQPTASAQANKSEQPAAANAPTTPPTTTLDVPKPGEPSKVVQNSYGGAGGHDDSKYYRLVRRKLPLVNACYARQRRRNPQLRGKLTVEMTVRPKGDVKDARVVARSINSPPLEGCVVATVKGFHFAPSRGREPTTLTLPLLFR
ncbi:MAG: TonB family protein [Myxococcales bacterium]|nr:TonB family protein [Myxococcales bacterium]